ncbi:MAG: hypothetical protein IKQ43_00355 [Treponema sp.]|jgi:hypothetical protein|nr:hypothetical protein [Treponema sp.]MBR7079086.1 hypothetical protein [Treponema sp.]
MYAKEINLNAHTYNTLFTSTSSGRIIVPVKNNVAVYTQFEHVRGTPAPKGERGVPVDKIRILNTLIDRLITMKQKVPLENEATGLSDADLESRIVNYQRQIKDVVTLSTSNGTYGLAGLMPEAGEVFSISA